MEIKRIDHFVLTVKDIDRTCEFYSRVLGMEIVTFGENRKALSFGEQKINLHPFGSEFEPKASSVMPGSADFCLISPDPMEQILRHIIESGVEIEAGPVARTGAAGPLESVYLRDPDGNLLEISNVIRGKKLPLTESISLRHVNASDESLLEEMLLEAVYVPQGQTRPDRSILEQPQVQKYYQHWGAPGDHGWIAEDSRRQSVGAIWARLFAESDKGYGYIDAETPELSMAVHPAHRGIGIGSMLLEQMIAELKSHRYRALSLSVDPRNPALKLYSRIGFRFVEANGGSWTMIKHFKE